MAKTIDLRRHFEHKNDVLTAEGVKAAVATGKKLTGTYHLVAASGAHRTMQSAACLLAGYGKPVAGGVIVDPGLRSQHEPRWIELMTEAGAEDLEAVRALDPDFVKAEAAVLSEALTRIFAALAAGGTAMVLAHSPTSEAAVLGLTGQVIAPLSKGKGVRIVKADNGTFTLQPLT